MLAWFFKGFPDQAPWWKPLSLCTLYDEKYVKLLKNELQSKEWSLHSKNSALSSEKTTTSIVYLDNFVSSHWFCSISFNNASKQTHHVVLNDSLHLCSTWDFSSKNLVTRIITIQRWLVSQPWQFHQFGYWWSSILHLRSENKHFLLQQQFGKQTFSYDSCRMGATTFSYNNGIK